jgi:sec-independent protein translocase protein TatB
MIDLGLSKIAVIGVVALIVLGPERLPKIARVAGTLFGRAQRYIRDVKDEVSRDIELAELREMGKSVNEEFSGVESTMRATWSEAEDGLRTESSIGQPYSAQPYLNLAASRNGRDHWRVRTGRVPLWYKQQNGLKTKVTSEAARMARHRRYAAHLGKKRHSFFS